jgi:hypothetical protein
MQAGVLPGRYEQVNGSFIYGNGERIGQGCGSHTGLRFDAFE